MAGSTFCFGGLIAGLLLLRRIPFLPMRSNPLQSLSSISVIIPARNEESNLPLLLTSLRESGMVMELLVIDDGSTDETAAIATRHGATVIASGPLPRGWTGKTWACHQGARAAQGDVFCFLDADTRFVVGGFQRTIGHFSGLQQNAVLSILPFHRTGEVVRRTLAFFQHPSSDGGRRFCSTGCAASLWSIARDTSRAVFEGGGA